MNEHRAAGAVARFSLFYLLLNIEIASLECDMIYGMKRQFSSTFFGIGLWGISVNLIQRRRAIHAARCILLLITHRICEVLY